MPENAVLQSAPYKCLQSQFSVLYGEVTQVRERGSYSGMCIHFIIQYIR